MKRKNILKPISQSKEKITAKLKKQPENFKSFNDANLCKSDSEESIDDTITNYSVINRNKNQQNNLADFSDYSPSKRNSNKSRCNSPIKAKGSYSDFEKIDLKKKLFDFKILQNDSEITDPLKNLKKNKKKDIFNYLEFENYPCDHSAIKQIDFDLKIDLSHLVTEVNNRNFNNENSSTNVIFNKKTANDFSNEISAYKNSLLNYFYKNLLFYYEFKNTNNNNNEGKINNIEVNNNFLNNCEKMGSKITSTKEDIYIESLNYIFAKLLETNSDTLSKSGLYNISSTFENEKENKFFYILLPLYACYFFNNLDTPFWDARKENIKESGILISNISKNMEKKINDNEIEFERIDANFSELNNLASTNGIISRRKNSESRSIRNANSNSNNNINYISDYTRYIQGDNYEANNDSSIIYIKNFNQILFFNQFINSYEENSFKIISPFPFANSQCLTNQFFIDVFKNEENSFTFKIKIIGFVFQTQLKKLLTNFQKISETFSFNIYHFYKTTAFHLVNENLKYPIENVKYENKKFYVRTKK